jgi:hypothetical protein
MDAEPFREISEYARREGDVNRHDYHRPQYGNCGASAVPALRFFFF